ncbi:MAG: VacJ family lipoprotein [Porticoccaceae bacterium]|nr:VacJ family lipoprotein [Porticoccaceae bacterium]
MRLNKFACAMALLLPLSGAIAEESAQGQKKGALEGFNRAMHGFNHHLDKWLLKPVTKGYKWITPDPVERGVSNVFGNLKEVVNIPNDLLQGKFKQAANDTGRLLVNTTIGVGGLFEVADSMGLKKSEGEDLGQTLASWGVPAGPYVVVPFFGPSTLRDLPAGAVDSLAFDVVRYEDNISLRNSVYGLRVIDTRSQLLDSEELITGDRYTFIKDAYLQRREYLVNDGEVEDDFGSDYGDQDDEY